MKVDRCREDFCFKAEIVEIIGVFAALPVVLAGFMIYKFSIFLAGWKKEETWV